MPRKAAADKETTEKKSRKTKKASSETESTAPAPAPVEEADPCPVCLEPYTAVLRKAIPCPSCHAETCSKCMQRYLIETTDDPHCLHCKHGFDRMFLQTTFTKAYMNTTYADHRAKILWAREESYLPAAQIKAERITRGYKMMDEIIHPLYEQIGKLNQERDRIYDIIHQQESERNHLLRGEQTRAEIVAAGGAVEDDVAKARKQFTRKCTTEGCLGWLSSAWKCGLCDNYTCKDCYVIKGKIHDAPHECKKDDLETAELIRTSCKSCPKCGEAIEKREGCDMMFCTSCHTPFSWKTLEIISRGNIHNPHYFEWRNRVGANAPGAAHAAEPLPCGGMPADSFIYTKNPTTNQYVFDAEMRTELSIRYRITAHIEGVEAPFYASHTVVHNTEQYRIRYLLKEMTKEFIEKQLQAEERQRERDKAIRDVLDTYLVAAAEQFRIIAETPTSENARRLLGEVDCLRDFINETMMNVHKAYGCTVPLIEDNWRNVERFSAAKLRQREKENTILHASDEYNKLVAEHLALIRQNRIEDRELSTERDEFYRTHDAWRFNMPQAHTIRRNKLYENQTKAYTLSEKIRELKIKLLTPQSTLAKTASEIANAALLG